MGTENKDKDSKTEAVIDVIVAIGKTIFDILNERRKRWIILNVKKWNQILKKKRGLDLQVRHSTDNIRCYTDNI